MRQRDHQADHVLRAYRYQLLHALQEWTDLRPDHELLLEIDEDHAVVSEQRAENTQIKFSAASSGVRAVSLRSPGIVQAIERYWEQSQGGADPRPNLRVLTNSTAAREQGASLPGGQAGLIYWGEAARGGGLSELIGLLGDVFGSTPIGTWLQSNPSGEDVRARLLSRVEFVLGAPDDLTLQNHIRERLGMMYLGKGHYETAADAALPMLLDRVFAAASSPDPKARRLTIGDLHRTLEEALPRMGALIQAQLTQARPETGIGVTPLQLRAGLSDRSATVAALTESAGEGTIAWLCGANGVGKSTLAKLMARAQGGSWLVCDFRPFVADADSRGAVAVWRELMAALACGPPPDGIILDDVSARGIELLKSRLAGLAAAVKIRGAKIIITSNHTPSSALLAEIGATPQAALDAPYFNVAEIRELVEQAVAPETTLVEGWANLIHVSTSGGHPLLVTAKIANLQARGWPDQALLEDLGAQANEGVRGTKLEARKRLLAELPAHTSARAVLERVSTVFQSFEDELVHNLCRDPPEVKHPLDALALLKGSWLEPLADGGWRLSPLLSDLGADVPEERAKRWRQLAAVYWLSKKSLNARTLPLCFWNAYLGRHLPVLLKLSQVIMQLPPGQIQSAAAMLSPVAAFRTDRPMAEEPMTACGLRLLQVVVADAIEDDKAAAAAAEALLGEIDAVSVAEFRELETSLSAKVVLGLDRVWVPARTQIAYLRRLKATVARVKGGSFPELKGSMASMVQGLPEGADIPGLLLASVFMRMRNSEHLCEMIDVLAEMEAGERRVLIQSVEAVLQDLGTFIHNAWANEQLKGKDLGRTLVFYDRMRARVADWGMPNLESELAIAQSVILDECLDDRAKALTVVDAAIEQFGKRPALIRQKSKVLRHQGSNDAAASLLIEIEHDIGDLAPFDQGLALRDGGVAAANANRHDDALRLLRKADAVFAAKGSQEALRIGLTVDEAMVRWGQGQRAAAVRRAGDALEAVEQIDPAASRQNQRAHLMARALGRLFRHDLQPFPDGARPAVTPGMGSLLEASEKPERVVELPPLPDDWRILEILEVEAGVDADIAKRSGARQGTSRVVSIELNLAQAVFARALEVGDIDAAVRSIAATMSLWKRFKAGQESKKEEEGGAIRADVGELAPLSVAELLSSGWQEPMQGALVDIMMMLALSDRWMPDTARELQELVLAHWKNDVLLKPLLGAASGSTAVDGSMPMPVLVAFSLRTATQDAILSPGDRVLRDLYWLYQAASSTGRRVLEPMVVKALAEGWRHVLEHQRFALSMPMRRAPSIEAAIEAIEQNGTRAGHQLIEAAAEGAGVDVSARWRSFLVALSGRPGEAA